MSKAITIVNYDTVHSSLATFGNFHYIISINAFLYAFWFSTHPFDIPTRFLFV